MFRLSAVKFWFQTVTNGRYSKGKKHAGWKVEFRLWINKLCCTNTMAVLWMSDHYTWMWSFLGERPLPPVIVVIICGQPLAWKMRRSKVLSLPWTGSKRRVACFHARWLSDDKIWINKPSACTQTCSDLAALVIRQTFQTPHTLQPDTQEGTF